VEDDPTTRADLAEELIHEAAILEDTNAFLYLPLISQNA